MEDSDCEPHWSDQLEMAEASKAAVEAADLVVRLRTELQTAHRWANARAAVVNLSISAHDYREKLNELSEAEDGLASAVRQLKGEQP